MLIIEQRGAVLRNNVFREIQIASSVVHCRKRVKSAFDSIILTLNNVIIRIVGGDFFQDDRCRFIISMGGIRYDHGTVRISGELPVIDQLFVFNQSKIMACLVQCDLTVIHIHKSGRYMCRSGPIVIFFQQN